MKERPFADFAKELFATADEKKPAKLIVDLRFNEGGSTRVIKPFLEGLATRPELDRKDRLIVLIGRRTFSSASLNALEIKLTGRATFVGEPTGGNPSSRFRESTQFELPNSKLAIGCTTKFVAGNDSGTSVVPDVAVETSSQDYFAGRDPAMDKALSM
jgi:C-terminal processing protease CtpA/Prc